MILPNNFLYNIFVSGELLLILSGAGSAFLMLLKYYKKNFFFNVCKSQVHNETEILWIFFKYLYTSLNTELHLLH